MVTKRWRILLLVAMIVWSIALAIPARSSEQVDGAEFMAKVRDATNIRAAGSPAFRLVAHFEAVKLHQSTGPIRGSVLLNWISPGEWREEINFLDFSQFRVASRGKLWTARDAPLEPLPVYWAEQLMDFRSSWILTPGEDTGRSKTRRHKGVDVLCLEVTGNSGDQRKLCANTASFLPITIEETAQAMQLAEFGDYGSWANKRFPRHFQGFDNDRKVIELWVDELGPNQENASSLLIPPAGAAIADWCDDAQPPRILSVVPPRYPDEALHNVATGNVAVYGVVDVDGAVQEPAVVESAGKALDSASLAVVPQWRFRPAMCGDNPIPMEIVIEIRFTLRE